MNKPIQIPAWTIGTKLTIRGLDKKELGSGKLQSFAEKQGSTTYYFESGSVEVDGDHFVETNGKTFKVSMLKLP